MFSLEKAYSGTHAQRGDRAVAKKDRLPIKTVYYTDENKDEFSTANIKAKKIDKDYKATNTVKWNFTKFLIGKDGEIIARFEPTAPMKTVADAVKAAL